MDDRERDNEERKKFVGAANMKRVSLYSGGNPTNWKKVINLWDLQPKLFWDYE